MDTLVSGGAAVAAEGLLPFVSAAAELLPWWWWWWWWLFCCCCWPPPCDEPVGTIALQIVRDILRMFWLWNYYSRQIELPLDWLTQKLRLSALLLFFSCATIAGALAFVPIYLSIYLYLNADTPQLNNKYTIHNTLCGRDSRLLLINVSTNSDFTLCLDLTRH